jgi:septal ring factor EnvC (AmiA/AmiB activator)
VSALGVACGPRGRHVRGWTAALVVALLAPAAAGRDDAAARLDALREAIAAGRERVAGYERKERGLLETLDALERSAELLAQAEVEAREDLAHARRDLVALAAEEESLGRDLAQTRRALAARAVSLYKAGELGPVRLLFSAGSLREFLARSRALRRLLAHDRVMLDRQRKQAAALESARERTTAAAAARDRALADLDARTKELRSEQATRRSLLASVRGDREREREALVELERAARALEEKLASLHSRGPAGSFAARRGRLPAPVEAPVARPFGLEVDREFGTETFHKGIDYQVQRGATVRAVADGIVRFAGRFQGYGNLVILDHGDDYFTVSAHLDELAVEVGDALDTGATVGTAGETGSLHGPVLYFEVRHGAEALDPADWLVAGGGS